MNTATNGTMTTEGKDGNNRTNILYYPDNQNENETSSVLTFEEVCMEAATFGRPIYLTSNITLEKTIVLRKDQTLILQGGSLLSPPSSSNNENRNGDGDDDNDCRITITGCLHSLFLLNNKSRLIIKNIHLNHTMDEPPKDHKQVGAAINLRYKASVKMQNSQMTSSFGFCIWAVQKTMVELTNVSALLALTRSAVVCFGQVSCYLKHCIISKAGVHGLCARGACRISLEDCILTQCAARAIYAYANASVTVKKCRITDTVRSDKAAIEISTAGEGVGVEIVSSESNKSTTCSNEASRLCMMDCELLNNGGVGIRLRGPVLYSINNTCFENNAGGNMDILNQVEDDDDINENDNDNEGSILRRDSCESSFRQGDWWCRNGNCNTILIGRKDTCSKCGTLKTSETSRLLTIQEITLCNQGIDIRRSLSSLEQQKQQQQSNSNDSAKTRIIMWSFDGDKNDEDDPKGRWIPYDEESTQLLEGVYQKFHHHQYDPTNEEPSASAAELDNKNPMVNNIVHLSGGKYRVDIQRMEQVNVESHFLRRVRRQERHA